MKARKTVLFVTHRIDEAIYLSDRVVVFSGRPGKVKESSRWRAPARVSCGFHPITEAPHLVGAASQVLQGWRQCVIWNSSRVGRAAPRLHRNRCSRDTMRGVMRLPPRQFHRRSAPQYLRDHRCVIISLPAVSLWLWRTILSRQLFQNESGIDKRAHFLF